MPNQDALPLRTKFTWSPLRHTALICTLLSLTVAPTFSYAQYSQSDASNSTATTPSIALAQERIDQLLAPVALYPDGLLGHVLYAATRPEQVHNAARFVVSHPELQGVDLQRAASQQGWIPSVQVLVAAPSVLQMMAAQPEWLSQLGQAHRQQETQVLASVQRLRQKAYAQGSLQNTPEQRVTQQGDAIVIDSANISTLNVPYYDSNVVYGSWWAPDFPPAQLAPAAQYRPTDYRQAISTGVVFGSGVLVAQKLINAWRPNWRSSHWQTAYSQGAFAASRPQAIVRPAAVAVTPTVAPNPVRYERRRVKGKRGKFVMVRVRESHPTQAVRERGGRGSRAAVVKGRGGRNGAAKTRSASVRKGNARSTARSTRNAPAKATRSSGRKRR